MTEKNYESSSAKNNDNNNTTTAIIAATVPNTNSNIDTNHNHQNNNNDLIWSLTWTLAFPTLLPSLLYINHNICGHQISRTKTFQNNETIQSESIMSSKSLPFIDKTKNEIKADIEYSEMSTIAAPATIPVTWSLLAYREIFGDITGIETVREIVTHQTKIDNSNDYTMMNVYETMEQSKSLQDNNLGYGEITPKSIMELICHIKSKYFFSKCNFDPSPHHDDINCIGICENRGGTIIDLGSGTGRVLFAAALTHLFKRAIGIEIVKELHHDALQNLTRWNDKQPVPKTTQFTFLHQDLNTYNCHSYPDVIDSRKNISDIRTSISILDPSKLNILIIHATLFDSNLMHTVHTICQDCPEGTYFITVSKCLEHITLNQDDDNIRKGAKHSKYHGTKQICLLEEQQKEMTWGVGTVYILHSKTIS